MMDADGSPGLLQIGQIALTARDVPRAIAFYRDVLGLKFLFQAGQLGFLECGAIRLMLSAPEQPAFAHPSSILYFKVSDIRSSHRALEQRGVRFTSDPHAVAKLPYHELWMAFFQDSEDNILAIMSEVRG
jgi:predicted enzyme related to lactoylglutathione lyase